MSDAHYSKSKGLGPGAAKGLAHMVGSTPKTFHRDIKSASPDKTANTCAQRRRTVATQVLEAECESEAGQHLA